MFYLFLKERARAREGQRGGGGWGLCTEDPKWALHWQQWAQCMTPTHEPRHHDLNPSLTLNWLSHPGTLVDCFFLISSNLCFYYSLYFLKTGIYSKDLLRLFCCCCCCCCCCCWPQGLMDTLVYFLLHHIVCYPYFRESKIAQWVHYKDSHQHFS